MVTKIFKRNEAFKLMSLFIYKVTAKLMIGSVINKV